MSKDKARKPDAAASSPLVALAEMAREADTTHAVIVYRTRDGCRHFSGFEGMTNLEMAGLLGMALRDLAEADLPDEDDDGD